MLISIVANRVTKINSMYFQFMASLVRVREQLLHPRQFIDRILIALGDRFMYLETSQIAYFSSEDNIYGWFEIGYSSVRVEITRNVTSDMARQRNVKPQSHRWRKMGIFL